MYLRLAISSNTKQTGLVRVCIRRKRRKLKKIRVQNLIDTEFPFEVMLWNETEMMAAQHCEYTKLHCIVYFNMIDLPLIFKKWGVENFKCKEH